MIYLSTSARWLNGSTTHSLASDLLSRRLQLPVRFSGVEIYHAPEISLAFLDRSFRAGRLCTPPRKSACCCHPGGPWELSADDDDSLRSHHPSRHRYLEWVNPVPENAYLRRIDFKKKPESQFELHPGDSEALPNDSWPGNQWIYQVSCLHDQRENWHRLKLIPLTLDFHLLA